LLVVIEILMNSGTKKYYEKYKNIYDSRNFNELGNKSPCNLLNNIYDSRNFNELGNQSAH